MKKLILATLVSAASISAAYADGPTVYGKINASVDDVKSDLNSNREVSVDSNASRFGIKGSEKLTDNLSAIYQIEWGVAVDHNTLNANTDANSNGSTADLTARTRFIGLQYDGVGAIKIGRLDSNVKNLQYVNPSQGIDILDDYVNGTFDTTQTFAGENRLDNVVAFETAKLNTSIGTLQGNFLISPSEKTVQEGKTGSTGSTATSSSIIFTNRDLGLYTGIAYDSNIASYWNATSTFYKATNAAVITPTKATTNIFRWVGSADLGKLVGASGLTFNALAQQSKQTNLASGAIAPKETAYLLSADYNFKALGLDALTAKLQWQNATTSDLVTNGSDVKIDQWGVDVDYAFSAKTKVYGFVAERTIKNPNNPVVAANGYDQNYKYSAFGVGLEQKF
ncbi:MAG: porin [Gammaproteobacteria bacterium]|nr:porin [Gammaproteobacteria bacterium]